MAVRPPRAPPPEVRRVLRIVLYAAASIVVLLVAVLAFNIVASSHGALSASTVRFESALIQVYVIVVFIALIIYITYSIVKAIRRRV